MADIKKILIFSGVTLAIIGGGILTYKLVDNKKKSDDKAEKDAQLATLKAKLSNPSTPTQERVAAKVDIASLVAAPAIGLGFKLLDKLLSKPKTKTNTGSTPPTTIPKPSVVPDIEDDTAWDDWLNEDYDYYDVEEDMIDDFFNEDYYLYEEDEYMIDEDYDNWMNEEDLYLEEDYDYEDDEDYYYDYE